MFIGMSLHGSPSITVPYHGFWESGEGQFLFSAISEASKSFEVLGEKGHFSFKGHEAKDLVGHQNRPRLWGPTSGLGCWGGAGTLCSGPLDSESDALPLRYRGPFKGNWGTGIKIIFFRGSGSLLDTI